MKVPGNFHAGAALSVRSDTASAIEEAAEALAENLGPNPDVVVVFLTPDHAERSEHIADVLRGRVGADVTVGCTASGVLAGPVEVEDGPGIAIWGARMPGARVQSFHLEFEQPSGAGVVKGWPDVGQEASVVLLADPFSFPLAPFLSSLREMKKIPQIVGGVASGASQEGGNRLLTDEGIRNDGVVGFVVDGSACFEPLVSQGCRPVGPSFKVTDSRENLILELNDRPAYESLRDLLDGLDEPESRLFRQAPQVGLRKVDSIGDLGAGGFVIRGVTGINAESGAVAISDHVQEGLEIRFHARDRHSASQEYADVLGLASGLYPEANGGLLFTCTGRGEGLFGRSSHDAGMTRTYFPEMAIAGMFAAGEIGSVCGQPFIHGFSASLGLLVERN